MVPVMLSGDVSELPPLVEHPQQQVIVPMGAVLVRHLM